MAHLTFQDLVTLHLAVFFRIILFLTLALEKQQHVFSNCTNIQITMLSVLNAPLLPSSYPVIH